MLSTFNEIIKCLTIPHVIVLIFFLIFIPKKNSIKSIFIICLFVFLYAWRLFFPIRSSRYCSIFLIYFFIVFSLCYNRFQKKNALICYIGIVILLCIDSAKAYHGFRNNYIIDIQDDLYLFSNEKDNIFFIEKKEHNRFTSLFKEQSDDKIISFDKNHFTSFDYIYNEYEYRNDNAIITASSDCDFLKTLPPTRRFHNNQDVKILRRYVINRSKTKSIYLIKYEKLYPEIFKNSQILEDSYASDILKNGILVSCNNVYDVFIFQKQNKVIWFIGTKIEKGTWIIFHLYRNKRINQFSNLGFHVGTKYFVKKIGKYSIYEREIPEAHNSFYITLGFYKSGKSKWFKPFQSTPFKEIFEKDDNQTDN